MRRVTEKQERHFLPRKAGEVAAWPNKIRTGNQHVGPSPPVHNLTQFLRVLGPQHKQRGFLQVEEVTAHRVEDDGGAELLQRENRVIGVEVGTVQSLFFVIESDR